MKTLSCARIIIVLFVFVLTFYFQLLIWQIYLSARIYQKVERTGNSQNISGITPDPITLLKKAINLNPLNSEYHSKMGDLLLSKNKFVQAKKEVINALLLDPANAFYHLQLGEIYRFRPDILSARLACQEFKKAVFLCGDYSKTEFYDVIYRAYNKDYLLIRKIVPNNAGDKLLFANFLRDKNRYEESLLEFKSAFIFADLAENAYIKAECLNWMAIIYMWQGKLDLAIEYFNKAFDITKDGKYKAWILRNLGGVYLGKGNIEKAGDAFERSVNFDPAQGYSYFELGIIYEKKGTYSKAREYYKRALDYKIDDALRLQAIKKLEQLKADK